MTTVNLTQVEIDVKMVVASQFGIKVNDIENSQHFVDDLDADSLDAVELVMALEDKFDLEIIDEDIEGLMTVQSAIDKIIEEI